MHALIAAIGVAVLALMVVWRCIVYPVLLSPLASIPGAHPLAHITSLWIDWQRFRGVEYQCVTAAFLSKGRYVRLGPREVAVNDIDAVRDAWGVGAANFDKHSSYIFFRTHGTPNTFTTLLSSEHRHRRHRIRIVYSRAFLLSSPHMHANLETIVQDRLRPLLARIAASNSGATNILPLSQAFVLDYVSAFAFGVPLGHRFLTDAAALRHWSDLYNGSFPGGFAGFWLREHLRITGLLCSIGVPLLPRDYAKARRELEAWALQKVDAAERLLQRYEDCSTMVPGELPVLYHSVRTGMAEANGWNEGDDSTPSPVQRLELASECLDHIASTGETFGTTFTYMLYELSRHAGIQRELRKELQSIDNPFNGTTQNGTSLPESRNLESLPLLEAIIKESLRLRNTAPNIDPRVSPVHGSVRLGRISSLPPGTRVGTYGWWLNRNPDVYPDPNTWAPDRWLPGKSVDAASLNRWLFAFGSGSRGCIGQPIAMELMRMGLAAIYTSYETSIADESEYPGANRCMSSECSERLMIRFKKLTA